MKKLFLNWKFWLGIGISVLCLWLAFKDMDFAGIKTAFLGANYLPLLLVAPLMLVPQFFRSLRWQVILRPTKEISLGTLFSYQMIGFMVLNVLPMRLGEVVKAYLLSQKEKISTSLVLATVVVERIFDGLTVAVMLLIAILLIDFPYDLSGIDAGGISLEKMLYGGVYTMVGILGGGAVFLFFLRTKTAFCLKMVDRLVFFLPKRFRARLLGVLENFAEGLSCIRSVGSLLWILLYSVLIWLALALTFYIGMFCFRWEGKPLAEYLGYLGAIFVQGVTGFAVAAPSSPGFVGVFQFAVVLAFKAFGMEGAAVGSYSILQHAVTYFVITGVGFIFFWREGLSLAEMAERSEGEAEEAIERVSEEGEKLREEIEKE